MPLIRRNQLKNFLLGVMATVLFLVATGANYQDSGPKKYEYKWVDTRRATSTGKDIIFSLQNPGDDGWKLIQLFKDDGPNMSAVFIREKR